MKNEIRVVQYDQELQIEAYRFCGIMQKFQNHFHDHYVIGYIESGVRFLSCCNIWKNPEAGQQMTSGEIEAELIPQGTMAERIRCGGFGLGGFLTPTGVGTPVEDGKTLITISNKKYLLENPLKANIALIKAHKADQRGNLTYHRVARNFNPVMATAADIVIAEVEEIIENGEIDPDHVITPHIFIDYLVVKNTETESNEY